MDKELDAVLEHFGIRGMRWGVRRKRGPDGTVQKDIILKVNKHGQVVGTAGGHDLPTSEDAKKAHAYRQVAKASGTHSLSNQDLQHLVSRMNLEQQYSKLVSDSSAMKKGHKAVREVLGMGRTVSEAAKLGVDVTKVINSVKSKKGGG